MDIKHVPEIVVGKSEDILKGSILVCWYLLLLVAVSVAYENKAPETISNVYSGIFVDKEAIEAEEAAEIEDVSNTEIIITSPIDYLYFVFEPKYPQNMIIMFLNSVDPQWVDRNRASENENGEIVELSQEVLDRYYVLFLTIESYLKNLIENPDIDINQATIPRSLFSSEFSDHIESEEIKLSLTIANWIASERRIKRDKDYRTQLANTFMILIILGAFGSLIFLTKDYLDRDEGKLVSLAAYIFRPLFGMALAIAMFIVDIVGHSVISTGGIENIRIETMYLLGLSSGLIAEKIYGRLTKRLDKETGIEPGESPEST